MYIFYCWILPNFVCSLTVHGFVVISSNSLPNIFMKGKNEPSQYQQNVHQVKRGAQCNKENPRSPMFFTCLETLFAFTLCLHSSTQTFI